MSELFNGIMNGIKEATELVLGNKTKGRTRQAKFMPLLTYLRRLLSFALRIKWYIINRFIDRSHLLSSSLKPGRYHELDTRLLFASFEALNTFVECELAWLHVITHPKSFPVEKFSLSRFRNPAAGLRHLQQESSLRDENDNLLTQAIDATEVMELYNWWNVTRPQQVENMQKTTLLLSNSKDNEAWSDLLEQGDLLYKEETEMLVRLIKVRHYLWT